MSRIPGTIAILSISLGSLFSTWPLVAQAPKSTPDAGSHSALSAEKAITLAEQGRCKEALSALKRTMNCQASAESRKKAGVLGLRCSLTVDNRDSTLDFLRLLSHQFPQDP